MYANSAEYFPVDLEKYQLSYRLLDEVEEEGEQKYKLMVLAVPNEMIDAYKSLAKVCLLTLVDLDVRTRLSYKEPSLMESQMLYRRFKNPDILVKILISMRHLKRCGKKMS